SSGADIAIISTDVVETNLRIFYPLLSVPLRYIEKAQRRGRRLWKLKNRYRSTGVNGPRPSQVFDCSVRGLNLRGPHSPVTVDYDDSNRIFVSKGFVPNEFNQIRLKLIRA